MPREMGGLSRDVLNLVIILEDWGHEVSGCSRLPRINSRHGALLAQSRKSNYVCDANRVSADSKQATQNKTGCPEKSQYNVTSCILT